MCKRIRMTAALLAGVMTVSCPLSAMASMTADAAAGTPETAAEGTAEAAIDTQADAAAGTPETAAEVTADAAVDTPADAEAEAAATEEQADAQAGWVQADGKKYYRTEDGTYLVGLQKVDGSYYYFNKHGVMQTGWKKISGDRFYLKKSGKAAVGYHKVNGTAYIFGRRGKQKRGEGNRIVRAGDGRKYYVDKRGCPISGWHYVKDIRKVIKANKKGRLAVSKKVDGIAFNKKGYCRITNQGLAKMEARKFIEAHTKAAMSKTEKFRVCWRYIIAHTHYIAVNRPQPYFRENWVYRDAVHMFTSELAGDCNGIASVTAAVAKELGYQPYVIRTTNHHSFVIVNKRYFDNMYGAPFAASSHRRYRVREKIKF